VKRSLLDRRISHIKQRTGVGK